MVKEKIGGISCKFVRGRKKNKVRDKPREGGQDQITGKAVQATIMTLDVTLSQMESLWKQRIICYRKW